MSDLQQAKMDNPIENGSVFGSFGGKTPVPTPGKRGKTGSGGFSKTAKTLSETPMGQRKLVTPSKVEKTPRTPRSRSKSVTKNGSEQLFFNDVEANVTTPSKPVRCKRTKKLEDDSDEYTIPVRRQSAAVLQSKGASKNLGKALTNRKNGADPGLTSTDLAELGADNGEAIDKESGILDLLAQEMKRVDESDDDNDDDYCPDEEVEDIDEHPDRAVEPLKGVTVNVKNEGDGESKLDARLKARNLDGSIPAQNGRYHGRKLVMWHRPRMIEKLLLHVHYECHRRGLNIPWDHVVHRLSPGSSGSSALQHLTKLRDVLTAEGHMVPPLLGKVTVKQDPSIRGYVRDMSSEIKTMTRIVCWDEHIEDRKESLPLEGVTRGSGNYRRSGGVGMDKLAKATEGERRNRLPKELRAQIEEIKANTKNTKSKARRDSTAQITSTPSMTMTDNPQVKDADADEPSSTKRRKYTPRSCTKKKSSMIVKSEDDDSEFEEKEAVTAYRGSLVNTSKKPRKRGISNTGPPYTPTPKRFSTQHSELPESYSTIPERATNNAIADSIHQANNYDGMSDSRPRVSESEKTLFNRVDSINDDGTVAESSYADGDTDSVGFDQSDDDNLNGDCDDEEHMMSDVNRHDLISMAHQFAGYQEGALSPYVVNDQDDGFHVAENFDPFFSNLYSAFDLQNDSTFQQPPGFQHQMNIQQFSGAPQLANIQQMTELQLPSSNRQPVTPLNHSEGLREALVYGYLGIEHHGTLPQFQAAVAANRDPRVHGLKYIREMRQAIHGVPEHRPISSSSAQNNLSEDFDA